MARIHTITGRHGYVAYDPQLERVFSPEHDAMDAVEIHRDVQAKVFQKSGGPPPHHRRPWWKVW